ncbi:MAG: YihY/virulence factor BrkB family protein [Balneolaceae bacterium]
MNKKEKTKGQKGRKAEKPSRIPKAGWKEIIFRIKDELTNDHISIVSAGVAYYFFVALFPTLIAAISIYGLVVDPVQVEQQMNQVAGILPEQASQMISTILENVASQTEETLSWGFGLSMFLSLWFAHNGTSAVFEGINIAYNETDERGFFKQNGITLLFTIGGIIAGIICTALVVVFPALVKSINLPAFLETLINWLRWPLLAFLIIGALGLTYKIAPDRSNPEFRWLSTGAVTATALWLAGSLLFSLYIDNFGNYDEMYGSFAAVIILLLWFFITAFIILLGAEINSELEHQTQKDTTTGEDKPMGERGAYHADRVAGMDKKESEEES